MSTELPQPPLISARHSAAARHVVPVLASQSVGTTFHRLRLGCTAVAASARPGQFVHVLPQAVAPSSNSLFDPLLRRAFSIMGTSFSQAADLSQRDEGVEVEQEAWFEILFRVGGRGTSLLARSQVGDLIDVLGPLGNGFFLGDEASSVQPASSPLSARPLLLVGGGIGVPPLVFAAQHLLGRQNYGASQAGQAPDHVVSRETGPQAVDGAHEASSGVEAFIGARNAGELVCVEALQQAGARVHIATDDGSAGQRGLVTQLLRVRLEQLRQDVAHQAGASTLAGGRAAVGSVSLAPPLVCACGPWPMLKAVAKICREMDVECLVSLEENMPCGIGVCNGCVVPLREALDDYERLQRICVHGPVLNAGAVDWDDESELPAGASQTTPTPAASGASGAAETPDHQGASQ